MTDYKIAPGSRFSREWRRNKRYSERELRMLCRRRKCSLEKKRDVLLVLRDGKVVAQFNPVAEPAKAVLGVDATAPVNEVLQSFAAIRLHR